ncbi:type II CAAX prenyl endopeptidase Rce1 family protein [Acidovorax sp. ST3]|uniref:CPBP family glutamic-type intramembrane protease n=1 Tax=Acidovorax sp. ST3 TaxID=2219062 RepID=UPI0012906E48|nr:CPBP family glutamic-type intramembrane protease [Acidovorax sp. ST3]
MTTTFKRPIAIDTRQRALVAWALVPVLVVWQLNGLYLPALGHMGMSLFWVADGFQWLVLPTTLLGLLAHRAALRPQHYGLALTRKSPWPLAARGLAVFITAGLVFLVARNLSWRVLGPSLGSFEWAQFFPQGLPGTAVQIYAAVSAGLVESIFFIGLPWLWYMNARQHPSERHFTLAVSAIFALAHWEHGRHIVIAAFFSHLVMCRWFLLWRTLWPVVLGHTMIDLAAFF